jgi:hypothetical protein
MTRRLPETIATAIGARESIVIRRARPDDEPALAQLAVLAGRALPREPLLLAEADGSLVAALALDDHALVADPFRVTLDLTELLALRGRQLRAA